MAWNTIRAPLSEAETDELDKQFCGDIEYLISAIYDPADAPPLLEYRNSLRALVKRGASARLMKCRSTVENTIQFLRQTGI
ncbi:hypothetical protein [Chitinophaga sp. YR627]|uniref:hypothetical protein n=1 Tax=Chitinophaga sp. YR627 TaxID=1881041 RepID=UPI000B7E0AE6|nr:hypothetical protein [Chitinophaga sp. YR627]